MPPTMSINGGKKDAWTFLDMFPDPGGCSTSGIPGLPGLEDTEDEDSQSRHDGDDDSDIHGESPNTSQSTMHGQGDDDDDEEEDEEFERERTRRETSNGVDRGGGEDTREYELRTNINRGVFVGSGYADHDPTGDYDPEGQSDEDLEMERIGRGRKRAVERTRDRKGKRKAKARRSESRVREEEDDGDVGMQDVDAGVDDDAMAMDGLDLHQAQTHEDKDEDEEDNVSGAEEMAANSDVDPEEMRVRKAAKRKMPKGQATPPKRRKQATPPKLQSCLSCTKHKVDCTILDDPASYPCFNCQDTKCGCILRTPYTKEQKAGTRKALSMQHAAAKKAKKVQENKAKEEVRQAELRILDLQAKAEKDKRKRACRQCKEDDKPCSNERLDLHEFTGQPCKRCVKYRHLCFIEEVRPREDEEQDEEEEERRPLPRGRGPRPHFGSAVFDNDHAPEAAGLPNLSPVGPDGEPPKKCGSRKSRKKRSRLSEELVVDETPGEAYVCKPGFSKKQITTSFCHPFVFNAPLQADDEYNLGCDLHTTAFSIFGYPVATPWVTYPDQPNETNRFRYEEIPGTGGHSASTAHNKTNVCEECTFARQKILFCATHNLAGIKNMPKPREFNFDAAYAPLLSDQDLNFRANEAAGIKWCSICPAPAFLECCTVSPHDIDGSKAGCGLMLCEICAIPMLTPAPVSKEEDEKNDADAAKEVKALLNSVKKVNIATRQAALELAQGHLFGQNEFVPHPIPERAHLPAKRQLEDVIEAAKEMVANGGGIGGKYMDGLRADVELISQKGWLWEWMEWEAYIIRQAAWRNSGVNRRA